MALQVFISLATLTFIFGLGNAQDCTALAAAGNCDFYPQCVETRIPCGTTGYALNFGKKYCNRLASSLSCFKFEEGQGDIQVCIMQAILKSAVYKNNGICEELLEFAYSSHPDCYVDIGFCTEILQSVRNLRCLIDILDDSDILTRLGIQQIYETAEQCNQQDVVSFLSSVDGSIQSETGRIEELLTTLRDLLGGCESGLDLVFVLESSGSGIFTMRSFVAKVIAHFEIRANSTRVGVILFSNTPDIVISLGSINNVQELTTAINRIDDSGDEARTDLALDMVPTAFNNSRIDEGIPSVVILLTDNRSNNPTLTAQAAARVHNENIEVYSVGIGDGINKTELQIIASDPSYVYLITDFSPEAFTEELRPLQLTACTTPALFKISQELQTTISRDQAINLKYNFPPEGLTIKIKISVGELVLYGSFTIRSPSSLTADFEFRIPSEIDFFVSPELYDESVINYDDENRRRRQDTIVFVTLVGQGDINTFFLNTTFDDTTGGSSIVHPLSVWTTSFIACLVMIISFSGGIMNMFAVFNAMA